MHRYIFVIGLLLFCISCNKWLDVNPKGRVGETALFEDEQGFKDALMGVYTQMASRPLYAKELTMGMMEVFSGNYDVEINTHRYYEAGLYQYDDAFVKSTISGFWANTYRAIANINNLLEVIDDRKQAFSGSNYEIIKGEALALRAYLHFDLLRAFGPVPADGLDQSAIPYLKAFSMTTEPSLPAKQVIEHCIADLDEAIALLSVRKQIVSGVEDVFLSHTRQHMNYWAATGLLARIYLYQGKGDKAYEKAKEVIDSGNFPFVTASSFSSSASPDRLFSTEHIFSIYVANLEDINAELFTGAAGGSVLTNEDPFIDQRFEIALVGSTDYRYLFLWKTEGSSSVKYPAKYWLEDTGSTSRVTRLVPLIRLSEMYYIAAETASQTSEQVALLNAVRTHRGLHALPETLTAQDIDAEIFKAYKKEFYQEGQLFYYYKRKKLPQIEGYALPVDASIYILPRPDDEIELNP